MFQACDIVKFDFWKPRSLKVSFLISANKEDSGQFAAFDYDIQFLHISILYIDLKMVYLKKFVS